ncbi:glycosyltransferase [Rarobacter incanus]|uniref:Glycosyltransferase involved in cell wall biosynthesis n=1 Tax=Rarobacter incanus TaxID=153494 RepID=A0A542SPP5_9MICO|nr:glycosyltransferase family 4 protein [Rarobacter incanus]TQK76237.1 glycosyltransferase involved in cell wall biosynthesis [Rarobacter incanus]
MRRGIRAWVGGASAAATRAANRAVAFFLRHRVHLPRPVNRAIDWVAENPASPLGRLAARAHGSVDPGSVPPALEAPDANVSVLIGPTNYAGQGWLWARALESAYAPTLAARNLAVDEPAGFSFPADREVPVPVYQLSTRWQTDQLRAARGFTHVMFEAQRPLFGRLFDRDIEREVAALGSASIAMMCHGTDIRLPSRHQRLTPWSPYLDPHWYIDKYERDALANRRLLDRLGVPVFVSTPDLLLDVPYATWCPVVVDVERWAQSDAPAPGTLDRIPTVVHIPSRAAIKGTHLVEPALRDLDRSGLIRYVTARDIPTARMPDFYASADIVIDQFRLGSYGVAACEAMAAGRVVVGHVADPVRARVRAATGADLPIVEATVASIADVIVELIERRAAWQELGQAGRAFVRGVHSGPRSAQILNREWIRL